MLALFEDLTTDWYAKRDHQTDFGRIYLKYFVFIQKLVFESKAVNKSIKLSILIFGWIL